jgi:hypothetical protein
MSHKCYVLDIEICFSLSLSLSLSPSGSTGIWTQVKQALYHLSHAPPSPFCFSGMVLYFLPKTGLGDHDTPIYASHIAGIIDVKHHAKACFYLK